LWGGEGHVRKGIARCYRRTLCMYEFNAHEIFEIAIEIEENGRIFYEKARDKIQDPEAKKIFTALALAEVEHKKRFASMKSELPSPRKEGGVWDPDHEMNSYLKMMADMHVFRSEEEVEEQLSWVTDTIDALNLAIQFEKDSIIFFLDMQEASTGKEEQESIGRLIKEEREHLRKISLRLRELTK
jgi:rubrerythrin